MDCTHQISVTQLLLVWHCLLCTRNSKPDTINYSTHILPRQTLLYANSKSSDYGQKSGSCTCQIAPSRISHTRYPRDIWAAPESVNVGEFVIIKTSIQLLSYWVPLLMSFPVLLSHSSWHVWHAWSHSITCKRFCSINCVSGLSITFCLSRPSASASSTKALCACKAISLTQSESSRSCSPSTPYS